MNKIFLKLIKSQKSFLLKSQGSSMFPLLQPNDIIYFKKIPFSKIKVNDAVVLKKKNQIICHRLIYKNKDYLVTKGDNTIVSDGKIFSHQILGIVFKVKRNGQIFNPENLYLIQSAHYLNEIIKIKKAFERENLNYLFLKGLPLHLYFEGKHPNRFYADCDVLIKREDFKKAQEILFHFGYKKLDTSLSKIQKKLKDKESENVYYKIINGFQVVFDLHLEVVFMMTQLGSLNALYPQSLINQLTADFLKTKRKIKINSDNFWILDFQLLILYLSLHLFHHNFQGAFRYQFLDTVIKEKKPGLLEFEKLAKLIKEYQLENFLYPAFFLLKKYYQTPIPKQFLTKIQPKNPLTYQYVKKIIKKTNIFDEQTRFQAGITRFKNLFFLSPRPLWQKIFVFFNHQVILALFFVLKKRLLGLKLFTLVVKLLKLQILLIKNKLS